jgi:hypothetical protein
MAGRLVWFRVLLFLIIWPALVSIASGLQTSPPDLALLVNQAGYDLLGWKRIWLQADFDPSDIRTFQILKNGRLIFEGRWKTIQKIEPWNKWYRQGDVSSLSKPGVYQVRVEWQGRVILSPPFVIGASRLVRWTGPLAVEFFFVQRCGTDVPGWHAPCHLDDGRLPDGRHIDLTGGWHDAGDYNKYNGYTPLAVYALAKFAQSLAPDSRLFAQSPTTPLDEAVWGAEWLRKCQDPESRRLLGYIFSGFHYWGVPENETDNIPGTSDDRPAYPLDWNENEMAVSAYSALFKITGEAAWNRAALDLWTTVSSHDSGSDILQWGKRLLAAVELHRSLGEAGFVLEAEKCADVLLRAQQADGRWPVWTMVDSGLIPAALADFVRQFPRSRLASDILRSLGRYLADWQKNRPLPFDIPKWDASNIFFPYLENSWHVGQNSRYLSQAWSGFLISQVLPGNRSQALQLVQGCLDWVLGANPLEICMMCGAGSFHLRRYHHRYETIPNGQQGNVPGAICNGITRAEPAADMPYLDLEGNSWQTNEPWLPHNAYYLLCLAEMDKSRSLWEKEEAKRGAGRRGKKGTLLD